MNINYYKKNNRNKVLTFILTIAICISMFPLTALGADGDDITEYVDFGTWNMSRGDDTIVSEGSLVNGAPKLQAGQNVIIKYNWSITPENAQYITEGSFFLIDTQTLDFDFSNSGTIEIKDGDTVIATLEALTDSDSTKLKITFTSEGAQKEYYDNGWVTVSGSIKKFQKGTESISINGVNIPVEVKEESNFSWSGKPGYLFKKYSTYKSGSKEVTYSIVVNEGNYKKLFGNDPSYADQGNVRIEDYLPAGMKIKKDSLVIYGRYYLAMGNEVSSNAAAKLPIQMSSTYFSDEYRITDQFEKIVENDPTVEYDTFKENIDKAQAPTLGIYQNSSIYINAGDLQGELKYGITWGAMKAKIDAVNIEAKDSEGNTINAASEDIKEKTKIAYARIFGLPEESINNTANDDKLGYVIGFIIQFTATIVGNTRELNNEANMYKGESDHITTSAISKYVNLDGGVNTGNPGDVRLIKLDQEEYTSIAGAKFVLQKMNYNTKEYENISGSKIYETNENGELVFEGLHSGKYRIIETEPAEGYATPAVFKEGAGEFKINGHEEGELQITAYNYKITGGAVVIDEEGKEGDDGNKENNDSDPKSNNPKSNNPNSKDGNSEVNGKNNSSSVNNSPNGSVLGTHARTGDPVNNAVLICLILTLLIIIAIEIKMAINSKNDN